MRTAEQIAKDWADGVASSTQKMRDGVNAVQENPMEKAAQRKDAWVQGVMRARDDGSYERGLRSVTLQQWKQAMIDKGVARVATGATAAIPKMRAFLTQIIPHIEAGQQMLKDRPRGDLSANVGRMVAFVEHMAKFKKN